MFRFHLRSRFGRRLFGLSLLAALLPMGGLAAFAYHELYRQMVEATHGALRQDSKALGMELVSELNRRAELLRTAGAGDPASLPGDFTWIGRVGADDAPIPVETELAALARHGVALRLRADTAPVLMVRQDEGKVIAGRLDPTTLWRRDVIDTPYCVLDRLQRPFYCSTGLVPPPVSSATLDTREVVELTVGDERYLGSYWYGRLEGRFGAAGFRVLMTVPAQALSAPLNRLRMAFGAMFLLAVGLAVAFAANQIGRHTRPLDALMGGVRRLARGELDARVDVRGDDELALFGHTLNAMSASLEGQFNLLRLLAELDRAVLSSSGRESVTDTILRHVLSAIPCDRAGVLRVEDDGCGTYRQACRSGNALPPARDIPAALMQAIARQGEDGPRVVEADLEARLAGHPESAAHHTLLLPVLAQERLDGMLVLALPGDSEHIDAIRDAGRGLADRMAVAGSSLELEEKLHRQSHYDALTGLPNRMLLRDRVAQSLMRAESDRTVVALLLVSLYEFKQINEALGPAAGDTFLVESARRLDALRRPNDTVSRLGGNEFALLVTDLANAEVMATLHAIAERVTQALGEPVMLCGVEVVQRSAIGVSLYPDNANNFDGLLKLAEMALHEAKTSSGARFHFYSESMNRAVTGRFDMAQDLRRAIANDELLLFYQPKVSAGSGEVAGAEALIRWRSPTRGLVSPAMFLPVLEGIGLNAWLTGFVLERACAQMAAWDAAGHPPIPVSVNVAPSDLAEADFCDRIAAAIARHGLDASRLELEILESSAVNAGSGVRETLLNLRRLGVKIALDDFGTGYSSLVYLTELPADVLKLDRAFVRNMVGNARQQSIVERVISLARSLGLRVVAEGVEDADQRDLLVAMHCDMIQGFLFSRPLPPEEFIEYLRASEGALEPA
jgi:diguanylate cyclase (GGDEF)-like protein